MNLSVRKWISTSKSWWHRYLTSLLHYYSVGSLGERTAVRYLRSQGFRIVETNWKSAKREIDIIAQDGPTLIIAEVKTRRAKNATIFAPEDAVNDVKQHTLHGLAEIYLAKNRRRLWNLGIRAHRFDIITVCYEQKILWSLKKLTVNHLIDAF